MHKNKYLFLISLLSVTFLLVGCESQVKDPRLEDKVVSVISIKKANNQEQSFTGIVTAKVQSNLGFRVSGKIINRFVDNGQEVKKGQALMKIDNNDLNLSIAAKDNAVKALEARFILANTDEKRYKKLLTVNAISQQAYDQAKSAADSIYAELNAAKAQVQVARNEALYSVLYADSDGTIVEVLGEAGQVVNAGQTVIKLAHSGSREAAVDLPETVRPELNSKAQAKLFGSEVMSSVTLRQLSDSADASTRTYEARYILSGDIQKAPIGATVTVYLSTNESSDIEVPLGAITNEGKGSGVWIYDTSTSTISFKKVEITSLTSETAIIRSGLGINDKIVALGAHYLHEGQKVRLSDRVIE
jgi:RND family efflux transporter MFP subunit